MAQDIVDRFSYSSNNGLHNMLTGLTLQSPVLSPIQDESMDTNASTDAVPTITPTVESATLQSLPIQFNTPTRSIFSSGPPTSSVSVNTAQASMAGASPINVPRTFFRLTGAPSEMTSMPSVRESQDYHDQEDILHSSAVAESYTDGTAPTMEHTTSTGPATSTTPLAPIKSLGTPTSSAAISHLLSNGKRVMGTAPLPDHLYTRGFRQGRHSDITVHAFSTSYALHRLLLDRSPFFSTALSEHWMDSNAKEITLYPEKVDSNITQKAFELALGRLYGSSNPAEEKEVAASLFATGCWLEMTDLIDCSVNYLMSQMTTESLPQMIEMVSSNYYGKPGRRILLAAKAMLCREGWEMPLEYWDRIPGYMIRDIIGGDGFFVPGEWQRWVLAKKLLNRRLKIRLAERGPTRASGPDVRHHSHSRRISSVHIEDRDTLLSIYSGSDIEQLLVLLEHNIYYTHMTFEQLQYIQDAFDILGQHIVPTATITEALWMSTELRQMVLNQPENSLRLGLRYSNSSKTAQADAKELTRDAECLTTPSEASWSSSDSDTLSVETEPHGNAGSHAVRQDGSRRVRSFRIPTIDSTRVLGHKAGITSAKKAVAPRLHLSSYGAMSSPLGILGQLESPKTPGRGSKPRREDITLPQSYSSFPPYRFAVEFPNPLEMKERQRIYSRIIWYAGSMWNIYVQKLKTNKNVQIGVYLHRVRDNKEGEELLGSSTAPRSVDEAIGNLEREMLMRKRERKAQHQRSGAEIHTSDNDREHIDVPVEHSDRLKLSHQSVAGNGDSEENEDGRVKAVTRKLRSDIPALPPYSDRRITIFTYFKIYEMSPDGRTMNVHKSMPDIFSFSHSWGWKTVLDESQFKDDVGDGGSCRDKRLRYSIVLGNI